MKLFIDTTDPAQVKEDLEWGIIDGVTTNPSHVSKTERPAGEIYREICAIVEGPISLETIGLSASERIREGQDLVKIHKNVMIKIPVPSEGLKAVKALTFEYIKTNATATFSTLQAMLAAKCGARYIRPFVRRLDVFGHIGIGLTRQIKTIYFRVFGKYSPAYS